MKLRPWTTLAILLFVFAISTTARAASPVELELATERGVQITAPHEWLQLLTGIGINNVRIRGARPSDQPQVTNQGTAERPHYHVTGILNSRGELRLPGAFFTRSDRGRLKDYFDKLSAEGGQSLTAARGMFGLTESEIQSVFADLSQPVDFETVGLPPSAVLERLQKKFAREIVVDAAAARTLREAEPVVDDLNELTAGTALAMMLRPHGLVLRPEKPRGKAVAYRIAPAPAGWIESNPPGKTADHDLPHWPLGWELKATPGKTAPSLFEFLNAEINGYTLEETLAAVSPRLKIPYFLDHAALAAHGIDPAKIQVRLPRTRTFYKRVLDRVLTQARLGSELRLDESGKPFLWITR